MKYFFLIFGLFFLASNIEAQKVHTMTGSGDTIVNNAVDYVTTPLVSGYNHIVFGAKVTKNSGTVGGLVSLEQSYNGIDYETVVGSDTLTVLNQTSNSHSWQINGPAYPYYRIKFAGPSSGSASARIYGYFHVKKY